MANEYKITAAFVQQFHDTYELQCAQQESRFLKTVYNRGEIEGASFTINDMGIVEMQASGARFGDTAWTIPDAGTRTAIMTDYDLFIPIESRDLPKLKANPQDKYMKVLLGARQRKVDDVIYQALVGGISRTTVNDAGTKSTTTVNLPAGQIILAGGTGMTKAKLIQTKALFRKNECDEQNGEKLYIAYSSDMLTDILSDTTLTSADFMAGKMLQEGKLSGEWLGFNWIAYEKLNDGAGGSTEARTVAWCSTAAHYGHAKITDFDISKRPDKKNISQIGGVESMAAGRTNESKVVAIDFVK